MKKPRRRINWNGMVWHLRRRIAELEAAGGAMPAADFKSYDGIRLGYRLGIIKRTPGDPIRRLTGTIDTSTPFRKRMASLLKHPGRPVARRCPLCGQIKAAGDAGGS